MPVLVLLDSEYQANSLRTAISRTRWCRYWCCWSGNIKETLSCDFWPTEGELRIIGTDRRCVYSILCLLSDQKMHILFEHTQIWYVCIFGHKFDPWTFYDIPDIILWFETMILIFWYLLRTLLLTFCENAKFNHIFQLKSFLLNVWNVDFINSCCSAERIIMAFHRDFIIHDSTFV